jgi:AraC-like DNA-binding protein
VDLLSDVITRLRVRSILSARLVAHGPWALQFPEYRHVKFGSVIEGNRWLWTDDPTKPVQLQAGDFYLLTDGKPYCFASDLRAAVRDGREVFAQNVENDGVVRLYGNGTRTVGAGGRFFFDEDMSSTLLSLLPPLIIVSSNSVQARSLRAALDLIEFETDARRLGREAVANNLASVVLINVLRAYVATGARPRGWLSAIADDQIGPALALMHRDIAQRWTLKSLSLEVGMSRTAFAERFRMLVGSSPLHYLNHWRLTVARNALRSKADTIGNIASAVGYESETSFSTAFKRAFGCSPGRYRVFSRDDAKANLE